MDRPRSGQELAPSPRAEAPRPAPVPRAGDPLGLGLAPGARPTPADPEAHDLAREDREYARSLLSPEEKRELDAELATSGFWHIDRVRAFVAENTTKGSVEAGGLDPEMLCVLDARINYKIFVAGDNLYTRAELLGAFPFQEMGVEPEAFFAQQEVGVFARRAHLARRREGRGPERAVSEFVARDAGDTDAPFASLEDTVRAALRPGSVPERAPHRVAKTKVFVGKERWRDFQLLARLLRGVVRVAAAGGTLALPHWAPQAPLALGPGAEAALRQREEELDRREEALRQREAAQAGGSGTLPFMSHGGGGAPRGGADRAP